jgi:sialidase-1
MNTVVWYSDDMGGSYRVSGTVFPMFQECQVVELPGGRLLMNMRNSHLNSCDCRAQATSDDGGVSWSPVFFAPDLVEPVCSAGLLQLASGPLLFSNPHSASERVNMTLMASHDDGQSWQPALGVWPGPSAYSVLTALPNQRA